MSHRTVIVTYDVRTPIDGKIPPKVYDVVREKLGLAFLRGYLVQPGHIQNHLTHNTFAGEIEAEDANDLLESIFGEVEDGFVECEVRGRCFVYVGGPDEAKDVRNIG